MYMGGPRHTGRSVHRGPSETPDVAWVHRTGARIFASPIAVMAPVWEALARRRERGEPETPRYLQCRHESLAVSLASGYYKATGRPQAVFLPTGLGVLNGAMALRTALQERTPMTVLSPDTLTYGEVDGLDPGPEWPSLLVDLPGPARYGELSVKWAKEAKTPADLVHELRRALYFAEAIPRGPTLVSVPFDLLLGQVPFEPQAKIEPQPFIYRFRVVVDPQLNAFALPGGYIYFHSGTLLQAASVDELALLEVADPVGVDDGGKSMGDHEAGASFHQALQSFLNAGLGFRVESGGGVIQDEDPGVGQDSAGDSDTLFLTDRELDPLLPDLGIIPFGQT